MEFPNRIDKHVTETSSFKIFSNNIPDAWIIREVTERDYGIDCYIELVNRKQQVTGELISIQLKGMQSIKWTRDNHYTFSSINISTTNYWRKFPTPVFICLVDIQAQEVFYCPVKSYIRKYFFDYLKQKKYSYKIEKQNKLEIGKLDEFVLSYFKEKWLDDFENHMTSFISHYQNYEEFIENNIGRDCFMGVEINRVLYLKHFYNNLRFLCNYFNIEWNIMPLEEYFKKSRKIFGTNYDIYEQQIDEVVTELDKLMVPLLLVIRDYITVTEEEYWMSMDLQLYNTLINVKDDGSMPFDW